MNLLDDVHISKERVISNLKQLNEEIEAATINGEEIPKMTIQAKEMFEMALSILEMTSKLSSVKESGH